MCADEGDADLRQDDRYVALLRLLFGNDDALHLCTHKTKFDSDHLCGISRVALRVAGQRQGMNSVGNVPPLKEPEPAELFQCKRAGDLPPPSADVQSRA